MSTEITTSFVKQYGANVFHLSQQKGSKLRNSVRVESVTGDSRFFDRIGKAVAAVRSSRHADTPQMDTPHSRRMVTLSEYEYADLVDQADKIKTLNDPTNEYSMAAQWALGRSMDDVIIDAASGNAYGGVGGATSVVLPTTQKLASVASAAGASLNVQALRRAAKILDGNDVDESEQRFFAFNAYQKEALLSATEVTSADFNSVKALVMGQIDTFMGFKFIRTELLNDRSGALSFDTSAGTVGSGGGDANGYDQCLAWAKSGLLLAIGQDIKAEIAPRADKSFSTQVYASMSLGATRMEEEKVVEVLCKDS
jgi:Phage capsid protein